MANGLPLILTRSRIQDLLLCAPLRPNGWKHRCLDRLHRWRHDWANLRATYRGNLKAASAKRPYISADAPALTRSHAYYRGQNQYAGKYCSNKHVHRSASFHIHLTNDHSTALAPKFFGNLSSASLKAELLRHLQGVLASKTRVIPHCSLDWPEPGGLHARR